MAKNDILTIVIIIALIGGAIFLFKMQGQQQGLSYACGNPGPNTDMAKCAELGFG